MLVTGLTQRFHFVPAKGLFSSRDETKVVCQIDNEKCIIITSKNMYFHNVTACTSLSYQITFEWGGVHGVILKEKILQAYLYKKIIYTITATKKFKHIQ